MPSANKAMTTRPKPPETFDENPPLDADSFRRARPSPAVLAAAVVLAGVGCAAALGLWIWSPNGDEVWPLLALFAPLLALILLVAERGAHWNLNRRCMPFGGWYLISFGLVTPAGRWLGPAATTVVEGFVLPLMLMSLPAYILLLAIVGYRGTRAGALH
jgi:hypothetical protein